MTTPQINVAALVDELAELNYTVSVIDERAKTIKAILLDQLQVGTHTIGDHQVQVKAGASRIDLTKVEANHPFDQNPEIYKLKVDLALAKDKLTPEELRGYSTHTAPSVVVK